MTIADQIQEIITRRQKQANHLDAVVEQWKNIKNCLRRLESEQQTLLNSTSEPNSNVSVRLRTIDLSKVRQEIDQELREIEVLQKRLSRETLNIGVVGKMRQGKSRLLQSVTGLTDEYIPTSSAGVCTRVLSKVYHEHESGKVRNEVEFHSYSSLQDILHMYFEKLGLEGSRPIVPDDLEARIFPPQVSRNQEDANTKHLSIRLRGEYYAKFNDYKLLLNSSSKSDFIAPNQIRQYTTQITDNNGKITNSEYLAVKELRIHCQFPAKNELGKIGVIDLPGLGDNAILDVELLIKTLKQDVDFILFVRRPDPMGDDWKDEDRQMYQVARDALGNFPIKKCSFMVFNKNKEQEKKGQEACERFQRKMESDKIIEVSDSVIADCANSEEVKEKILIPVLGELTKNIDEVCRQYLRFHHQRLEKLKNEINDLLKPALNALEGYSQRGGQTFNAWFEDNLWKPLNGEIYKKRDELGVKQNQTDPDFENQVEKVLEDCKQEIIVPSVKEIKEFRDAYGDSYKISYYMCINEVKKRLTSEFEKLATALENSERKLQLSVVDILSEHAKLEKLANNKGLDFFDEIKQQIPDSNTTEQIQNSFEEMKTSTTTYKKIISTWIQEYLNYLQPDKHLDPLSINQIITNEVGVTLKQINELKNTASEIKDEDVEKIEKEIENKIDNSTEDQLSEIGAAIMTWLGVPFPNEINKKFLSLSIKTISSLMRQWIDKKNSQPSIIQASSLPVNKSLEEIRQEANEYLEKIRQEISSLRDKVVDKCGEELKSRLTFPNEEAYAKFDKFVTVAIKHEKAQTGWRDFYSDDSNKAILWPGAEDRIKNKEAEENWKKLVKDAIAAINQEGLLPQT
ncbi:hypothetical protein NIES4106_20620 [Fischerella sp. NIES-4106]|nr:hypothetical protein NIES4106_20620 [Fischerella sp. NIES-4106]